MGLSSIGVGREGECDRFFRIEALVGVESRPRANSSTHRVNFIRRFETVVKGGSIGRHH